MEIIRSAPIIARAQAAGDSPDDEPYWRRAEISSDEVDSHITQFHISSLQNFEGEASEGVGILVRHKMMLPVGNTREGELKDNRVLADISVVRNEPLIGDLTFATTDGIIRQIEAGVIKAVSVGASGGIYECNICGVDMWRSWDCSHWPGEVYVIENDGKKEEVRCIPLLKDYHLDEVSLVHAGSNADAVILERSKRMLEDGKLNRSEVDYLNKAFRLGLPIDKANDKARTANPKEGNMPTVEELQQQVTDLQKQITDKDAEIATKDAEVATLQGDSTALQAEMEEVRKEVISHYKRVRGDDLTGEKLTKYENRIKDFDLEDLKEERELLLKIEVKPPDDDDDDDDDDSKPSNQKTETADPNNNYQDLLTGKERSVDRDL